MNFGLAANRVLHAVVRMELLSGGRPGVGTAFVYSILHDGQPAPFLVTTRSSVSSASEGRLLFTLGDDRGPRIGEHVSVQVSDFAAAWFPHPHDDVDLAIVPLAQILLDLEKAGKRVHVSALDESLIPGPPVLEIVEAFEELVIPGYATRCGDPRHLVPLLLKGTTASPFPLDFGGRPHFLIQVPALAGMAGSPVLLRRRSIEAGATGPTESSVFALLGILAAAVPEGAPVPLPPALPSPPPTSLALAVKASEIGPAVRAFLDRHTRPAPAP